MIERFDKETKYIGTKKACEHCNEQIISEWNEQAQDEALCDDCFDELNLVDSDDFIGYRKGE